MKAMMNIRNQEKKAYKVMGEFLAGMGAATNMLDLVVITIGGYFVYMAP